MTKLDGLLKRELKIHGIEQPIQLLIDPELGVFLNVKGSRKKVSIDWVRLVKSCCTEPDVPSFLMSRPFELLQHLAEKITQKKEKEENV